MKECCSVNTPKINYFPITANSKVFCFSLFVSLQFIVIFNVVEHLQNESSYITSKQQFPHQPFSFFSLLKLIK